jgi:sortase A
MSKDGANRYWPLMWLPISSPARKLQRVFFIFGMLALGYAAIVLANAAIFQRHAQSKFEKNGIGASTSHPQVTDQRPVATSGTMIQPVADGIPFARLKISRLNLDEMVVEGDSTEDLRHAIGHIPTTALPGNQGNVGIAGHRDTFFRPLRNIRKGDLIALSTSQGDHKYEVQSTEIVLPEDSWVLRPTPSPSLTLVTCYPFYYLGSAPKRFIVHAREVTSP